MRARQSLSIILKELNLCDLEVVSDWHLNERHYGNLTGYNKRDMANKYGEEQVSSRSKNKILITQIFCRISMALTLCYT